MYSFSKADKEIIDRLAPVEDVPERCNWCGAELDDSIRTKVRTKKYVYCSDFCLDAYTVEERDDE